MSRCLDIALHIEGALQRYSERHPIAWSLFIAKIKGARVSVPLSFEQSELLLGILKTAEDNQADAERWRALLAAVAKAEEAHDDDSMSGVVEAICTTWRGGTKPPTLLYQLADHLEGGDDDPTARN